MPLYEVTVSEIRRVQRNVRVRAESKQYARLAAESPENWLTESDFREDADASELTGLDVIEVREVEDDDEANDQEGAG